MRTEGTPRWIDGTEERMILREQHQISLLKPGQTQGRKVGPKQVYDFLRNPGELDENASYRVWQVVVDARALRLANAYARRKGKSQIGAESPVAASVISTREEVDVVNHVVYRKV